MRSLLKILNAVFWVFNLGLAALTLAAYALPFLTPRAFPILSVLSLALPFFLILNALFFLYWAVQVKRKVALSALVLLIGITFISKFYKFSSVSKPESEKDFTVMSYNVRLFNLFKWIDSDHVTADIRDFVNDQNPDILCLQEYSERAHIDLKAYPHHYVMMMGDRVKTGQGVFSKFPIIDKGKIEFPNSSNNAVFVDIKKGKDTIRVYSIHLQSVRITPDLDEINNDGAIDQKKSGIIFRRLSKAFREQQQQAEIIKAHKSHCPYPVIVCGDMNNSAFSYVYRSIRGKLNDCFEESGNGFGQTYHFKYWPARIDYIFADPVMQVKEFHNFPEFHNSDHYPIMTRLYID